MTRRLSVLPLLALALLQGCANYMYTGQLAAADSEGVERDVIVYWPMTDPLIGKRKAGPVMLLTECGVPIRFDQQPEGIVFRGNPNDDMLLDGQAPGAAEFDCGRFANGKRLVEIDDGPVSFEVHCRPVNDEFSAFRRSYIAANGEPYAVTVTSTRKMSLLGTTLEAPATPVCSDND